MDDAVRRAIVEVRAAIENPGAAPAHHRAVNARDGQPRIPSPGRLGAGRGQPPVCALDAKSAPVCRLGDAVASDRRQYGGAGPNDEAMGGEVETGCRLSPWALHRRQQDIRVPPGTQTLLGGCDRDGQRQAHVWAIPDRCSRAPERYWWQSRWWRRFMHGSGSPECPHRGA